MREYELIRSDRRTVSLEIRDMKLKVRAPLRMKRADVDEFVASREGWISKHLAIQQRRIAEHPEPDEEEKIACIKRAKELLPQRVEHYAALMGVHPAGITITGAKTRFGSCSAKKRLSFSWRLMRYSDEAIDYVVVHELAHLEHMDHSPRFYACVEKYMPDYKSRRKLLKE